MPLSVRKAVIPAAGLGTRFLPATKVVPKELLPIGNKPSIQYVIEDAAAAGIEEIILVSHPSKKALEDYFQPDVALEKKLEEAGKQAILSRIRALAALPRIRVVYQNEPLGLGHAVLCAQEAVGDESFVVLLPDVVVRSTVPATRQLIELAEKMGGWGLLLEEVAPERVSAYGIIDGTAVGDGAGTGDRVYQLRKTIEKPSLQDAPSHLAILGYYLFPPEIFQLLAAQKPGTSGEIQLTDAINALCRTHPGYARICDGELFDVGTPQGMARAWRGLIKSE